MLLAVPAGVVWWAARAYASLGALLTGAAPAVRATAGPLWSF